MKKAALIAIGVIFVATLTIIGTITINNQEVAKPTIKLQITGMHCAGCVVSVKQSLENVPGVTKVRLNAARAEATITMNDSIVNSYDLINAVKKTGFGARVE